MTPVMRKRLIDLSRKTVKVLENNHWTRGYYATNQSHNDGISIKDDKADTFCLVGSIEKAAHELSLNSNHINELKKYMENNLLELQHNQSLENWNDTGAKSKTAVINVLKNTVKSLTHAQF